jgi:formylglycine-generating enzyme required for sulfatase activity
MRLVAIGLIVAATAAAARASEPVRTVVNSIGMRLVEIPAGAFLMGSGEDGAELVAAFPEYGRVPGDFADEAPRRRVRISRPFLLGVHEVTVGDFEAFVDATGYRTEAERDGTGGWGLDRERGHCRGRDPRFSWRDPGFEQSSRHPVLNVSWNDAVAFCEWLSKKEGRHYRLPTEAEWEYACRAGATTRYAFGDDPAKAVSHARILDPTGRNVRLHVQDVPVPLDVANPCTVPVGSYEANAFGLFDMHGNVWEWVSDWYAADASTTEPVVDPDGPASGTQRVRRGGGWNSYPLWARASFRNVNTPASRCVNLGFRVAADVMPARTASPEGTLSIVFVGDIMLDNGPGHAIASGRDPFAACAGLLLDGDATVGNLECVLGRGGAEVHKPYTFRAALGAERFLKPYFTALGTANNHSLDYGRDGFAESLAVLGRAGIPHFGGGRTAAQAREPWRITRNGVTVAVIGCNAFQAEANAAGPDTPGVHPLREAELLADITAARKTADFVVPFVHWGPENVPQPRSWQPPLARRMVEAGAAAVIGAHPHVTQTVDVHCGAPIVYSLGNFVFDYYPVDPPEWTGWVAKLTFVKGKPVDLETRAVVLDAAGLPTPAARD